MRAFRLLALGALAVSATACTLWFALDDPYAGLGAEGGADAMNDAADDASADAADSAPPPSLVQVAPGVGSIAVFGDTLYANTSGQLSTCLDAACDSLRVLVPVDADTPYPPGLAADDTGVFWVAADGIWVAYLDGGAPLLAIQDANNPKALAADGSRVSWTTQDDAGSPLIRSCRVARSKCQFYAKSMDGGAQPPPTGGGGPIELVDAASSVDNTQLAAGPGYVVWVKNASNAAITYTPVDGGAWTPINPSTDDSQFAGNASTTTFVADDGPTVVYSFYNKGGQNPFVLERSQHPANDQGAYLSPGLISTNKSLCLGAANGVVGYCPTANTMNLVDEWDGGNKTNVPIGAAATPLNGVAVTSAWIFVLDNNHVLFKYPNLRN